jgi:MFS family permease
MSSDAAPQWKPHERPTLPGSPATPDHPLPLRLAYGAVGVVVGLTGGLGNGLVVANLANLQGSLGAFTSEAAWLPTVYAMTNVSMNLLLVKFRQQFGIRLFAEIGLVAYIGVAIAHVLVADYHSAVVARAMAGMAAAPLSTLCLYYMIQAFPAAHRIRAIVISLGVIQAATPLARLIPIDVLALGGWRGLYLFELGLALVAWPCVVLLRLPPSDRIQVFEPLDFVTFALFAGGAALLCAVLGLGRYVWWTEAPWVGWALVGAIALLSAAFIVEHNRANPLLNTRWLSSADILRLALSVTLVRMCLSEQTVGAIGLLSTLGLNNDQYAGLFTVVLAATVLGFAASAAFLDMEHLPRPVVLALAMIVVGALIDARSTSLTRAEQMYFSQGLIAFAGAIFMGPAMMAGFTRVLRVGYRYLASFSVLFNITQTLGGLAGSAAFGTLQVVREKYHANQLAYGVSLHDPQVAQRLAQLGGAYAKVLGDPTLRAAEGQALLARQVTREANVLAYDDVFLAFAAIAGATLVWMAIYYARKLAARARP